MRLCSISSKKRRFVGDFDDFDGEREIFDLYSIIFSSILVVRLSFSLFVVVVVVVVVVVPCYSIELKMIE
jgi:hypothetical protein